MFKLIGTPAYDNLKDALRASREDSIEESRLDTATMMLARDLEFVSAATVEVFTDPIKGRTFLPFTTVPDGADSYVYLTWNRTAMAEWISNHASAVGAADAFKTENRVGFRPFGSSYRYSIFDLQRAAFSGVPLERQRAISCRIAHEQFLDKVIAEGDADRGVTGLLNTTDFQAVQSTVGEWDFSDPEPVDPDDYEAKSQALLNDLNKLIDAVYEQSSEQFSADTLILPLSMKKVLNRRFSRYDARTRLAVFLADAQGVSVNYWKKLDTASALGGPKALAYKKSAQVLEFVLKYDFREMPVQAMDYSFQVLTYAEVGGLVVRYPLACARMDLDEDLTP